MLTGKTRGVSQIQGCILQIEQRIVVGNQFSVSSPNLVPNPECPSRLVGKLYKNQPRPLELPSRRNPMCRPMCFISCPALCQYVLLSLT